jgi:hypothetical protein
MWSTQAHEKGSDSKNFGMMITGIRAVVVKIWLKEYLGAKLEF